MIRLLPLLAVGLLLCTGCADGKRNVEHQDLIAFIRQPWNTGEGALFVAHPDGSFERRLSDPDDIAHGLAWRADGSRLSYLGWETLFDLKPDGTDRRALYHASKYYSAQGWSPDGRYLALGIGRANMHSWARGVSLLPEEGGDLKHLEILGATTWSPDGRLLAYTEKGSWDVGPPTEEQSKAAGIYTIDVESQERTRLTRSGTSLDLYPAWFPDGRHIAFLRYGLYEETGDLYLLTLSDRRVVQHASGVEEFAVAPEGSRWAWATTRGLFTSSLGDPSTTLLTRHAASSLTWSADGRTVAYVSGGSTRGRRDIYTVSIEDRRVQRVTKTAAEELEVQWRPD